MSIGRITVVLSRELRAAFVTPAAYFLIGGFMLLAAVFFFGFVERYNTALLTEASRLSSTGLSLNHWVFEGYLQLIVSILIFVVPILAMGMLSTERANGRLELLSTTPLTSVELVLGKFLAIVILLFIMLIGAALLPLWLAAVRPVELYPFLCGLSGVFFCAVAFGAIGLAISSFFSTQIVAAGTGVVLLLLLSVVDTLSEQAESKGALVLRYLSPVSQTRPLIEGVITLESIVYFISLVWLALLLAIQQVDKCQRG